MTSLGLHRIGFVHFICDLQIVSLQVDPSFDFSNFVSDYLAEEFSHVVRLEFLMWVVAIVWIAFPSEAYAGADC